MKLSVPVHGRQACAARVCCVLIGVSVCCACLPQRVRVSEQREYSWMKCCFRCCCAGKHIFNIANYLNILRKAFLLIKLTRRGWRDIQQHGVYGTFTQAGNGLCLHVPAKAWLLHMCWYECSVYSY